MVELARHGVDQTTISFETVGSNEASVNLRDVLLNENLDYHFCVSSLSVPFDEYPIFPPSNAPIMRIIKRNTGIDPIELDFDPDHYGVGVNVDLEFPHPTFTLGNVKFRDVATLVERIQSWCQQFNEAQTVIGITQLGDYGGADNVETAILKIVAPVARAADGSLTPIHEYITAVINPEGLLQFTLSVNFCNHFAIQLSRYGIELLGLQQSTLAYVFDGWEHVLAITTAVGVQSPLTPWVSALDEIEPGNNTRAQMILSRSNVYQLMDHRISLNVQSHLPIANNMIITDGKEGLDNAISRTPIQAPLEITQRFTKQIREFHEIKRKLFNGQVQLIKKSQSNFQWHRLLTSFQLKFIRLSLWASYRRYNPVTNTWFVKNDRLTIPGDRYWETTLRFISDT